MNRLVIANWKMNMQIKAIGSWFSFFENNSARLSSRVIIAPSYIHLFEVSGMCKKANFSLSSQDVSEYESGAHTGDVGVLQIKECCTYSIVGHSERKESLDVVIRKRDLCLKNGITPIVCFSMPNDALNVYTAGVTLAWEDPENISAEGVFRPKDPNNVRTAVGLLRRSLPEETTLIYGGSVNKDNASALASIPGISGVLVGHASLDPQHFMQIIHSFG